jgi:hypothetical protein
LFFKTKKVLKKIFALSGREEKMDDALIQVGFDNFYADCYGRGPV